MLTARIAAWPSGVGIDPSWNSAGVVNDGIHPSDRVHLVGDASRVNGATQVADDHARGPDARSSSPAARSRDRACSTTSWPSFDERPCGGTAQAVCAAGDEDPRHAAIMPACAGPSSGSPRHALRRHRLPRPLIVAVNRTVTDGGRVRRSTEPDQCDDATFALPMTVYIMSAYDRS